MKCTDCNGSGVYVGLSHYNEREDCERCGGSCIEPGGKNGSFPLRDYQQAAVDAALTPRALWEDSRLIERPWVLHVSKHCGQFPGHVRLELNGDAACFMDAKYDDGQKGYVNFHDANTGVHWILMGRRKGNDDADDRWMTWDTVQVPRRVIQDYAQQHYLALYQRIEMKNEFKCLWHY
jgi:hypothetical protein